MITDVKGFKIFYKYFIYGSAVLIGTFVGQLITGISDWRLDIMYVVSGILIALSMFVTWTINKYPKEFKEEFEEELGE